MIEVLQPGAIEAAVDSLSHKRLGYRINILSRPKLNSLTRTKFWITSKTRGRHVRGTGTHRLLSSRFLPLVVLALQK